MTKVFTLQTSVMNGTVTMSTHCDCFLTRELVEEAKDAVEYVNRNSDFPVFCTIEESTVYENREEVPILNNK